MNNQDLSLYYISIAMSHGPLLPKGWSLEQKEKNRLENDQKISLYLSDMLAAVISEDSTDHKTTIYFKSSDADFQKTVTSIFTQMHDEGKAIFIKTREKESADRKAKEKTKEDALLEAFRSQT